MQPIDNDTFTQVSGCIQQTLSRSKIRVQTCLGFLTMPHVPGALPSSTCLCARLSSLPLPRCTLPKLATTAPLHMPLLPLTTPPGPTLLYPPAYQPTHTACGPGHVAGDIQDEPAANRQPAGWGAAGGHPRTHDCCTAGPAVRQQGELARKLPLWIVAAFCRRCEGANTRGRVV